MAATAIADAFDQKMQVDHEQLAANSPKCGHDTADGELAVHQAGYGANEERAVSRILLCFTSLPNMASR